MKKRYLSVALIAILASSMMFTSCIGSFKLTNKVLTWNKQVGSKFVNELVFVAFWILPVYELSGLADLLVLNSIEFWSGENPVQASTKTIDGKNGRYIVKSDKNGYTITNTTDKSVVKFNFDAADCTPDSIINVSDITMVINLILSGSTTEVVGEWEVNTEDNVNIDDFNLAPGETRSIDVKLCNSQAYTALQFDLRLPEGLEIVSIGKADRIANHNIHSGTLPDGTVRFIAYNMQNADIKGNGGAIITLVVKASQALAPSDAIEVSHTVLATASDESFFAPVTVARVGNTTGVADVSQSAAKVYSQAGRVVIESAEATTAQLIAINGMSINLAVEAGHNEYEAPAQGVYIVRIAGKSHKLVVRN